MIGMIQTLMMITMVDWIVLRIDIYNENKDPHVNNEYIDNPDEDLNLLTIQNTFLHITIG